MESSRAASIWEGAAGKLIALLILVPLIGFGPQLIWGERTDAQSPKPAWVNVLLITTGTWPLKDGTPDLDALGLRDFLSTASGAEHAYAPTYSKTANAAALLSGLKPTHSKVFDPEDSLHRGTWTLAKAAAQIGNHTAAFLEEPLVTNANITGFDELREQADWGPTGIADAAFDFWDRHQDRPSFLWLHLADAGPGAERAAQLVERLTGPPLGLGPEQRMAFLVVLTALGSDGGIDSTDDSGFRVPMFVSLPGGMAAGSRGQGMVQLTDLAIGVCQATGIAPPLSKFDSRSSIISILQGVHIFQWGALHGPDGYTIRNHQKRLWISGKPRENPGNIEAARIQDAGQDTDFIPLEQGAPNFSPKALHRLQLKQLMPKLQQK